MYPDDTCDEYQIEFEDQYAYVVVPLIDGYGSFLFVISGDCEIEVGYMPGDESGDLSWFDEYGFIERYDMHDGLIVDYVMIIGEYEYYYFSTQEEFDDYLSQFIKEQIE